MMPHHGSIAPKQHGHHDSVGWFGHSHPHDLDHADRVDDEHRRVDRDGVLEEVASIAAGELDPIQWYADALAEEIDGDSAFDGFGPANWIRIGLALSAQQPGWAAYYLEHMNKKSPPGSFDVLVRLFPIGGAVRDDGGS